MEVSRLRSSTLIMLAIATSMSGCSVDKIVTSVLDNACKSPQPTKSWHLSSPSLSLKVGETATLTAWPLDANGALILCAKSQWSSTDTTVATAVEPVVRAIRVGSAYIKFSTGTAADSIPVTVSSSPAG